MIELDTSDGAVQRRRDTPALATRFRLRLDVALSEGLELALDVTNTSSAAFTFEAALHTYLRVGDVGAISITGLEGAAYVDHGLRRDRECRR